MGPSYRVNAITGSSLANPTFASEAAALFDNNQSGILTNAGGDFGAWEKLPPHLRANLSSVTRTSLSTFPADWPEIEFLSIGGYLGYQNYPLRDSPNDGYNYATVAMALEAPLSRGTIDINSPDMADPPLINPQWLTHPTDQAVAVAGYKRVRELFGTKAMQKVVIGSEYFPGTNVRACPLPLPFVNDTSTPSPSKSLIHTVKYHSLTLSIFQPTGLHRRRHPPPNPAIRIHRLPRSRHLRHGPQNRYQRRRRYLCESDRCDRLEGS